MCGIGGISLPAHDAFTKDRKLPISQVSNLWEEMSDRGNHACGFAIKWTNSENVVVVKQPGSSLEMSGQIEQYGSSDFVQYVMLHTRYATQGSTAKNYNNHPVVGYDMVVTHNGVLSNDRQILKTLKRKPMYDVDTEAINASLRLRSPKYTIEQVKGSMSISWVDVREPDVVHLMTNGQNPLVIARLHSGAIVWASMEYMIEEAGFDVKSSFIALPFKEYQLLPDGRIISRYVSRRRAEPDIGFRYVWNEASQSVSTEPAVPKSPKTKKKPQNGSRRSLKGKKNREAILEFEEEEYEGWRYSSETGWYYAGEGSQ